MAINPELITTIRVDQLPDGTLNLTNKIPHTSGTVLEKASVQELVDLVATSIGVSGGVGYIAISVTDGQQLPDVPELPSFFLCGAGTFLNINGYPNIICTENLNAIMSLTDHWELAVEIPINPLSGTVQSVTGSAVDNTDPLNPVINLSASTLQAILDNNHDLIDGINFQGTGAGTGNSGLSINAFGGNAGYNNSGNEINAFGSNAVFENSGNNVNAFGTNAGFENRSDNLNVFGSNAGQANTGDNVNAFGAKAGVDNIWNNVNLFGESATADANNQNVFSKFIDVTTRLFARLSFDNITDDRKWELPDQDGTIALTSDIPAGSGGIPNTTASGTDTYTAAVTGVTSYTNGDAYLVRFTNGNTTGATLNINSLGAITLYRNNDGAIIGGDIQNGAEMLCVYNSTLNAFQCIGTSPNTIIAYVTNADSVTLTKGMPVYAFGGTGDRMIVKRAYNTGDSTSAQTVGIVLSTSIATNQKGIIILQGLLDGLSILPTSTFADGDTIYLGATAGTITNVKPYAPNHLVYLGVVTTASAGAAGKMYVKVQNGYELDELHNVQAQSPSNNDTLYFDNSVSQWKTASISTILGFTPENSANKSTSTSDSASSTKFPVWSAILSYFSASQIRSILGISTLSGSNTGDQDLSVKVDKLKSFNRQTSSYTLVLGDADKLVEMNVATANNLTIPLNSSVAYSIGTQIDIVQYGAGQTTIVPTSGVTIRSANSWVKINARYGAVTLTKVGTDEWYLWGNLNA